MNSPDRATRKITSIEVREWFGNSRKFQLNDLQYEEIAVRLTKFRRRGDPTDPARLPWSPDEGAADDERWWDFRAVVDASKLLLNSLPLMLAHLDQQRRFPETLKRYAAIKALEEAITAALPEIENPFGPYTPRAGRKQPKDWHMPAILIARMLIEIVIKAEKAKPATSRNSVLVKVVARALIRMGYRAEISAIAMHLTRWEKHRIRAKETD
jgi:hypothetical protein